MLRYLGLGYRQFGLYPLVSGGRLNWEFYAVVRGRCGPVLLPESAPRLRASTLWVFPAGSRHGWGGDRERRASITAFHFGAVPEQLEAAVRERGFLEVVLKPVECRRLVALAEELKPHYHHPTNLSDLRFHAALIELSLLALQSLQVEEVPLPEGHAKRTVENALAWFADHVRQNPSVVAVADHVHVSASTLRRAFRQIRQESPAQAFSRVRIEAAMRLMYQTSVKLDLVAEECGFSSTSDFCRAFKARHGATPNQWRRRRLIGPVHAREQSAAR